MPRSTMSAVCLNPLLCEGQIHGGIVQGVGQALMENIVYDPESGQLLSGSFQDYCMPRADDFCRFDARQQPDPDRTQPARRQRASARPARLGAIPAVMNAVNDALADRRALDRAASDLGKAVARPPSGDGHRPRLKGPRSDAERA